MKKLIAGLYLVFVSSLSFGAFQIDNVGHDAQQTGEQAFFDAWSFIWGTNTTVFQGIKLAAGYKASCPSSFDQIGGNENSGPSNQSVSAYATNRHSVTGWSSYSHSSTTNCALYWQWAMGPSNTSISGSVEGLGIGWSMNSVALADANTETFVITKLAATAYEDADPLVLDFAGNGMRFTSLKEGVLFDLDADGVLESVSWTEAGVDDSFLFIDLNENGIADDGAELFTNYTAQPALRRAGYSKAVVDSLVPWLNGYDALAMLDRKELRGNRDGMVGTGDHFYKDLYLWNDVDHNGYSDEDEVISLKDAGIKALSLDLEDVDLYDEHGNWIEFTSWAYAQSSSKKDKDSANILQTADVWFNMAEIYP
jgi:hypothetical protein